MVKPTQISKIIDMLDSTFERKAVANETNGRANDTDFYSVEMAKAKNTIRMYINISHWLDRVIV